MATEESPPGRSSREPARRLFFALWPDEPMRQAMAQATRTAVRARRGSDPACRGSDPACRGSDPACGGRPVSPANLHVTLAFLGATPERRLPQLAEAARMVALECAGEPLELSFDHLEYWRAAHLLCASPAEASEPAAALAGRLQARLAASGFAPDLKPFRPHVTVARKVARPAPAGTMHPVLWRFTEFALVESRTLPALRPVYATGYASGNGTLYSVVESYALCSRRKAANNNESP